MKWIKAGFAWVAANATVLLFVLVVVAGIFAWLQLRDIAREFKEFRQYGTKEGGRTLQETDDSSKAKAEELGVVVPAESVAGRRGAPRVGAIKTRALEGDAAEAFEERTGLDVTGDDLVGGRSAADVDREKVETGGKQGRADVEAGPATDPWVPIKSVTMPATGRKGGTLDLALNLKTGETRPTFTIDRPRRVEWPNEFEFEGGTPVWSPDEAAKPLSDWYVAASWTPAVVWRGRAWITFKYRYEHLGTLAGEARAVGAENLASTLESYQRVDAVVRFRCLGLRTCQAY